MRVGLLARLARLERREKPQPRLVVLWPGQELPANVGEHDLLLRVTYDQPLPDEGDLLCEQD
jgi:hypothetical protein